MSVSRSAPLYTSSARSQAPHPRCGSHDTVHLRFSEDVTRGVIRVADGDEFCSLRRGIVQLVQIGSPAQFLSEMKRFESHAVVVAEAPNLHVVGQHHHHLIPGARWFAIPEFLHNL